MSSSFDLEAIVFSADPAVVQVANSSLSQAGINPVVLGESDAAAECLYRKKIDAIVVDLSLDSAISVLRDLPNTPSRRSSHESMLLILHRRLSLRFART